MKRILFPSVALLTFLCGYFLSWFYSIDTKLIAIEAIMPSYNVEIPRELKSLLDGIKPTMRGCGNGYAQGYKLPNDEKLGEGNACFSSFKEAKSEMTIWLKKSENIIETVAPSKQRGLPKSERVIASFPADEFGNKWVRIMWVHGRCIHWIAAPELEYAVEFEKSEYNPYKFKE